MKYQKLGNSDLNVSKICLGTMTFGQQNNEKESFELLDYAIDQGVNFIDTAEAYPVPLKSETYGKSEKIIGNWLNHKNNRSKVILATKIAGPGQKEWVGHIRNGATKFDKKNITTALENSLKSLQTDYLDLYQLHWPSRITNIFGQLGYPYGMVDKKQINQQNDEIAESIEVLSDLIDEGKIRYFGLSNESPWGMMKYIQTAEKIGRAKPISIQNIYNLLNRIYEVSHSEVTERENIALLSYSPLAFSILTGKYITKTDEPSARLNQFGDYFSRFNAFKTNPIIEKYLELAKKHSISLTELALSYIQSKNFVGSTIIGATNLKQLEENINAIRIELSDEILTGIEKIHQSNPNPCL